MIPAAKLLLPLFLRGQLGTYFLNPTLALTQNSLMESSQVCRFLRPYSTSVTAAIAGLLAVINQDSCPSHRILLEALAWWRTMRSSCSLDYR
jgi:hypothetical protein